MFTRTGTARYAIDTRQPLGPAQVSIIMRRGAKEAVQTVRRNLDAYLREWDLDGGSAF